MRARGEQRPGLDLNRTVISRRIGRLRADRPNFGPARRRRVVGLALTKIRFFVNDDLDH